MLERGRQREVIEVKLTSGPNPEDVSRLGRVAEMVEADRQTLICRVRESVVGDLCTVTNLEDYLGAQGPS